jgi:hypothetical protein
MGQAGGRAKAGPYPESAFDRALPGCKNVFFLVPHENVLQKFSMNFLKTLTFGVKPCIVSTKLALNMLETELFICRGCYGKA